MRLTILLYFIGRGSVHEGAQIVQQTAARIPAIALIYIFGFVQGLLASL
jgi:hypothetical protein